MWRGYLALGGQEILNGPRAYSYTRGLSEVITWVQDHPAIVGEGAGLQQALGDVEYAPDRLESAPWFDSDVPESARFYGALPIDFRDVRGSTRTATITEGLLDGGVVSGARRAVKEPRFRAFLIARGSDALDYGVEWLDAALTVDRCGSHGTACGITDASYYSSEPLPIGPGDDPEERALANARLVRQLHGVSVISGPLVLNEYRRGDVYGAEVEFTLAAVQPHVYTLPVTIDAPPTPPIVVQDTPYNLETHPSAELAGSDVTSAVNYARNPSAEVDLTHWSADAVAITGSAPGSRFTFERSTDISVVGTHSARARIAGDGVAASGLAKITIAQQCPIPSDPRLRSSVGIWAAAFVVSGPEPSLLFDELRAYVAWWSGGTLLREDLMGSTATEYGGRTFSVESASVPDGATSAIVRVELDANWSSNSAAGGNYDIRLYADALSVTVP